MNEPLPKVTAFITRQAPNGSELLLFRHPKAGIQIPAGTVEDGEEPAVAVIREAWEETGLTITTVPKELACERTVLESAQRIMLHTAEVYIHPDPQTCAYAHLRRGLWVELLRETQDWAHISFVEWDHYSDPPFKSCEIIGWVPTKAIAQIVERHFFLLSYQEPTPQHWTQQADGYSFEPFWAPLDNLPAIVQPQNDWLRYLLPS